MMRRYINEGLAEFLGRPLMVWHMPGHKRKNVFEKYDSEIDEALNKAFGIDVTEVNGTDDLYEPHEMILASLKELKKVYKSEASYYMVNGATGGILAALYAAREYARKTYPASKNAGGLDKADIGKILVASNCHKSVYNAISILGLEAVFIEPEEYVIDKRDKGIRILGHISLEKVRDIIRREKIFAMVLTSPTYEGVISDISSISGELKKKGALLIVDEAHGAHLNFFGEQINCTSATECGADIAIQSLHKTLPALTQTALMHVMNKELVPYAKDGLQIFMSSSPSYVMLCSMENAVSWACENDFTYYIEALSDFRKKAESLDKLHVLTRDEMLAAGAFSHDITRIVIATDDDDISGAFLAEFLNEEYGVVVEMAGINYVVLISGAADEKADFDKLFTVLKSVDDRLKNDFSGFDKAGNENLRSKALSNKKDMDTLCAHIEKLIGTVASDNLYVYPPGSYIVRRGEVVTEEKADELIKYAKAGLFIRGI